jgi:hypothetical protein
VAAGLLYAETGATEMQAFYRFQSKKTTVIYQKQTKCYEESTVGTR